MVPVSTAVALQLAHITDTPFGPIIGIRGADASGWGGGEFRGMELLFFEGKTSGMWQPLTGTILLPKFVSARRPYTPRKTQNILFFGVFANLVRDGLQPISPTHTHTHTHTHT